MGGVGSRCTKVGARSVADTKQPSPDAAAGGSARVGRATGHTGLLVVSALPRHHNEHPVTSVQRLPGRDSRHSRLARDPRATGPTLRPGGLIRSTSRGQLFPLFTEQAKDDYSARVMMIVVLVVYFYLFGLVVVVGAEVNAVVSARRSQPPSG